MHQFALRKKPSLIVSNLNLKKWKYNKIVYNPYYPMMLQNNSDSNFRSDINALRGIAILGVLLFHYKVVFLSGGFAGVDIFFVISGYLMTRIIINSINKNEFSFKDYFEKRLKRIAPALIFLILTLTIVCFFLYFPEEYKLNQENAAASIIFLSNILYWQNSNYFAPASDTNILLHTWSLSVEWQFYLIYPFVLLLLNKVFKSSLYYLAFFIGSTVFIFIISILFTDLDPDKSFYLLPTRSWEMLFGGIAFFTSDLIKSIKWRKALAIIGYISIVACLFLLDTSMPWPGKFTVLPVLATFLVVLANYSDFKIIRYAGIQFIGKISYSLYLWHWPIYVIAQYYGIGSDLKAVILFTSISIFFGYISFKYVETIKFKSSKPILVSIAMLFVCTASLSYFNVNHILFKDKTLAIESYGRTHKKELDEQFIRDICHISKIEDYDKDRCLCIKKDKINILLIGDSHLGQLSQSLRERLEKSNVNILQATASGTLPTIKNYEGKEAIVRKLMDYAFYDFIPKNADEIDGVIISGSWAGKSNIKREKILSGIKETIKYLKKYKINTIVIGQTERYSIPYATIAARDFENNTETSREYLNSNAYQLDDYLDDNLDSSYISVINSDSIPDLSPKNEPYMEDNHHVTKYGADLIVDKVLSDSVAMDFFNDKDITILSKNDPKL